ncbi:MAG: biotin/lipoate A/B protein ligase family protein [Candidatus Bathyarchaeia archaeon]
MSEWRLLDLEYLDPHMNMAVEEAILIAVGRGLASNTVRLWRNMNAVVLGYFQSVESEVNLERCGRYGTAIVRRFTGGGAVYHDHGNLNWTVVMRRENPIVSKDAFKAFEVFGKIVIKGIERLGVDATFVPKNSIHVSGGKVTGMAMAIRRNAILCHGTLLVNTNIKTLKEVLDVPSPRSNVAEVTTLEEEMGMTVSMNEVKRAVLDGLREALEIDMERGVLEEEVLAQRLYGEKYVKREWNFNRRCAVGGRTGFLA